MSANETSPPTPPPNTYDLQVEIWALKEELEDAKENIDTNFTRVAAQAAQIHRLRQNIRAKNGLLEEANNIHAGRVDELETEVASLRAALKQKEDDYKRRAGVSNRGLRELLDVVEDSPEKSDQRTVTANPRRHTGSPSPQQEPSSRRKRKATIQQDDDDDDFFPTASESSPMIIPQATHQKTSDAQMDERLAVVLDPSPRTCAEPALEQKPARGRRPRGSSRKRPKRCAAHEAHVDTATSSAPETTNTATTSVSRPSNIVVLKYRPSGSRQEAAEEGETTEEEVMVPRRGLRVKRAAKGRDTI
ncbi:MAG: hypothetical protein Q9207_002807 [Kuettlingeria erythrocarpa]